MELLLSIQSIMSHRPLPAVSIHTRFCFYCRPTASTFIVDWWHRQPS